MFSAKTEKRIQEEFDHLRDVVYLNSGLTSVPPRCVQQAYADEMEEFISSYGSESNWDEENSRARQGIAKLIGADPWEIALSNNTTTGLGAIAMGYPWDKHKNVVVYNKEHPANLFPWLLRRDEGRLNLKLVDAPPAGVRADDIIAAIDENTQAVTVSAVQYSNGSFVDLEKIGKICKEKGILLIVDGIQAIGRMNINVRKTNIDFLACGGHKGMLARNGVGFIYCRQGLEERIIPPNGSYQSYERPTRAYPPYCDDTIHWHSDARRFENGNHNHAGVCALIASTGLINEIGIANIEARVRELQQYLYTVLGDHARRLYPVSDHLSGIILANFRKETRDQVQAILKSHKVYATVRPANVRFCINFFNTEEQMEIVARAIKEIHNL
ncbi:MAG TPA: aminotransferase class V-fold PLP-dependent enzyme [Firmicutes bacterium]|jgi:cysteine desulfurase/selenocysteine lyase|nr:aminotransferase class V-fold PLP-dependent enzyme [Bacillota bacterium]